MLRTTQKELEALVAQINDFHGFEGKKVWNTVDGKNFSTVGMFTLYYAYGAVSLHRIANQGGGVSEIIPLSTKRELAGRLRSLYQGLAMVRTTE